jgi:DNA-binding response OmpR family regulator
MATSTRILVVDDETETLKLISLALIDADKSVTTVANGSEAIAAVRAQAFDVMILDMMMPDVSGIDVCEQVRQFSKVPIIVLSADTSEERIIAALNAGADEYVTKPFRPQELRARIQAILRRNRAPEPEPEPEPHNGSVFASGNLRVDLLNREVKIDGELVGLTPTEFKLLRVLIATPDQMVTSIDLLDRVWGIRTPDASHLLYIFMSRLRSKLKKLQGPKIVTERSVGYSFRRSTPDQ